MRVSWQEARDAVAVRDFVSSLSEHVSPEQPSGAELVSCLLDGICIELQPVACSWGIVAPAFNCDQDMPGLRSAVRVGRRISVSTRGSVGGSALPSTQRFEGWCSPRCFGPRTASGSCCGDGGPSLVRVSGLRGAYRPSNEHEDGRPVALKTDLAYTKMDQPPRQTNGRTAYQSESVNQVLPSKTHQVDSKQDYGPEVRTNLTLKKILHRVVKLILQGPS